MVRRRQWWVVFRNKKTGRQARFRSSVLPENRDRERGSIPDIQD
jgi:hypothetical protein